MSNLEIFFTLCIPILLVGLGMGMKTKTPKKNRWIGWRTPAAMKNETIFKKANIYAGKIMFRYGSQRELEEPHFNNNILSKLSPLAHHHFTVNTAPTTANTTTATPANVATAAFAYPIALATPSAFPTQFVLAATDPLCPS